jgi:transposase
MDEHVLARMLEEGLSLEAIGERVGKHPSTVGYWVKKHGLTAAHAEAHAAKGPLDRDTLTALVELRLTIREIADEVGRSPATVRHWLERYELRLARSRGVPAGLDPNLARTTGDCPAHGESEYIRRRDGAWRCLSCRSAAAA